MATENYHLPTITAEDRINGVRAINGLAEAVDSALKSVEESSGGSYVLPPASEESLGGVTLSTGKAGHSGAVGNDADELIVQNPVGKTSGVVMAVDDAYPTKPLGLKVYGKTRHNFWVNPSGTSSGVTVTSNDDGTVTVAGTSSTGNSTVATNIFYNLNPGSTYTISLDKETDFTNYGFYVQSYDGSKYTTLGRVYGSTKNTTITVPSSSKGCRAGVQITGTTAVSGTYRVMLNEGSTAEPWCPPGLNSVNELECVFKDDGEPPTVNTTPIDLQGHELCSLPDGTRDVLDVVAGTIAKSVGYIEKYAGEDVGENYIASALTDSGEIAQGAQVVYKLPEQQEVQLAEMQLPALLSPNVTAYASANVEAESEMVYVQLLSAVLSKLGGGGHTLYKGTTWGQLKTNGFMHD